MTQLRLKSLPLGIASWRAIRKQDLFFIDKTAQLGALVTAQRRVFLSRPRRMGKTLLCSILQELFTHGDQNFAGTAIYGHWPEQKRYPVIALPFIKVTGPDFECSLKGLLVAAFSAVGFPQASAVARTLPLKDFLAQLGAITRTHDLVFLIDEWDYPLSTNLADEPSFNTARTCLSTFYAWLSSLANIRFIFITGIMRYRFAEIFSNITDITMMPDYADILGVTEQELRTNYGPHIQTAAQRLQVAPKSLLAQLQRSYGGFCFDYHAKVKLYNPHALNQFFAPVTSPLGNAARLPVFNSFWMNSANTSAALYAYLQHNALALADIAAICRPQLTITPADLVTSPNLSAITPLQLLVQSGMITLAEIAPANQQLPPEARSFIGCLTNYDVASKFTVVITSYLLGLEEGQVTPALHQAQAALLAADLDLMCQSLNALLNHLPKVMVSVSQYCSLLALWLRSDAIAGQEESAPQVDLVLTTPQRVYAVTLTTDAAQLWEPMSGSATCGRPVTYVQLVITEHQITSWRTSDARS